MVQTLLTTKYRKTILLDEENDYVFVRLGPEQEHNGVAVIVLDSERNVLLTEAFRVPVGQQCLEIPRGGKEVDESLEAAAVREVYEETGLQLEQNRLVSLGDILPDSSTLRSRTRLFLAQLDCTFASQEGCLRPQPGEVQGLSKLPLDKVFRMAVRGEITDSFTLAAVLRAVSSEEA